MTYQSFLENKIDITPLSGIKVAESELNPALKPHQRVSVLWALRGGRRGIFARFGLGKSVMQLEWCRILQVHEGGQTLIVMPLNVLPEFRGGRTAAALIARSIGAARTILPPETEVWASAIDRNAFSLCDRLLLWGNRAVRETEFCAVYSF